MLAKVRNAVFLLLGCALALRLIWALVQPLVPLLVVLAFLVVIGYVLFGRAR